MYFFSFFFFLKKKLIANYLGGVRIHVNMVTWKQEQNKLKTQQRSPEASAKA